MLRTLPTGPAVMKVMGEWNWWVPAPFRHLHARVGWPR